MFGEFFKYLRINSKIFETQRLPYNRPYESGFKTIEVVFSIKCKTNLYD